MREQGGRMEPGHVLIADRGPERLLIGPLGRGFVVPHQFFARDPEPPDDEQPEPKDEPVPEGDDDGTA